MKLHINRAPLLGPWGGGARFVNSFYELAPELNVVMMPVEALGFTHDSIPDAILLVALDGDERNASAQVLLDYVRRVEHVKRPIVVMRVNENDARKATNHVDAALLRASAQLDGTIFVSRWLQEYFVSRGWVGQHQRVIVNGVDTEVFKPQPRLNNGRLNIVAHHWSDNPLKGFDIYDRLDSLVGRAPDLFSFTYIGRDRGTFKHSHIIPPLWGARLGQALANNDVYVSASRFDPGPNHITESISCGLPTYVHKDGGGCVEFAGLDHVYDDWEHLEQLLIVGKFEPNATQFTSWTDCVKQYTDFLEKIWKG